MKGKLRIFRPGDGRYFVVRPERHDIFYGAPAVSFFKLGACWYEALAQ